MSHRTMPGMLTLSEKVYAEFLRLYPAPYRDEYGAHMRLTFRDCARDALLAGGALALFALWAATLIDLIKTAAEERLQKGLFTMSRETLIRWGGPAMIVAGALWVLASFGQLETVYDDGFGGPDMVFEVLLLVWGVAFIPLMVGLAGLGAYAGPSWPLRAGAWLAIASCGVTLLAFAVGAIAQIDTWYVWIISLVVIFAGVLIFGLGAIREKPLPRWNWIALLLPGLMGTMFFISAAGLSFVALPASLEKWPAVIIFGLVGIGWAMLGCAMLPVTPRGITAPAGS